MKQRALRLLQNKRSWGGNRGFSLMVLVMLLTVAAAAAVSFIMLNVSLRDVSHESLTSSRLEMARKALQRYYLSHHHLPAPDDTNTVPTDALDLDQRYRTDANGNFFKYFAATKIVASEPITDIRGLEVDGTRVAAVLISLGRDQRRQYTVEPNAVPAVYRSEGDDILVGVPLVEEATRIARWSVEILQRKAIAYDKIFTVRNVRGVITRRINNNGIGRGYIDAPAPSPVYDHSQDPYYRGDTRYPPPYIRITYNRLPGPDGIIGTPDDILIPNYHRYTPRPQPIVDESGQMAAMRNGIPGFYFGLIDNDPDRGRYTIDILSETAAIDIAAAYGLNRKYVRDPFAIPNDENPQPSDTYYKWDSTQGFYSIGPNQTDDHATADDIIATKQLPQ